MCEIYHLLVECGIIYASASLASSSACLAAAIAASAASLATLALVLGVVNTVSEAESFFAFSLPTVTVFFLVLFLQKDGTDQYVNNKN
jgi:heme O synthase-like polyprenyltransferase